MCPLTEPSLIGRAKLIEYVTRTVINSTTFKFKSTGLEWRSYIGREFWNSECDYVVPNSTIFECHLNGHEWFSNVKFSVLELYVNLLLTFRKSGSIYEGVRIEELKISLIFDTQLDGSVNILGVTNITAGEMTNLHWSVHDVEDFEVQLLKSLKFNFENFHCVIQAKI